MSSQPPEPDAAPFPEHDAVPSPPQPASPAPQPPPGSALPQPPPASPVPQSPPQVARPVTPPGPVPAELIRVGDAEREQVADLLRAAATEGRLTPEEYEERSTAAYAARTRADLDKLTLDLPGGAVAPVAPGRSPAPAVAGAVSSVHGPLIAIFSGAERKGVWTCDGSETAVAVFGGVEIDFRQAVVTAPVVEINAVAVFGGVDITVPEGWHVELSGLAIFGGRDAKIAPVPVTPGSPVVRVNAFALFGGISVKSKPPRGLPPAG